MIAYVAMASYALAKLFMAVFVCDDGVWNVTFWKGNYGCVDLEHNAPDWNRGKRQSVFTSWRMSCSANRSPRRECSHSLTCK